MVEATAKAFQQLLARVRRGEQDAMVELLQRYEHEVRIVARARLGAALRPYLDSVDLVQSVHRSLLAGVKSERLEIKTPEHLLALALTIVRRKVARDWRRLRRQQRLSGTGSRTATHLHETLVSCGDSGISAERRARLHEAVEHLLSGLQEVDRRLIELRLDGFSTVDAATELGLEAAHARVRLMRIRRRLEQTGIMAELI